MRTLKKAFLILLVANLLRIIPGCCECDDTAILFNFNKLSIHNIDNSGDQAMTTASDTMMYEAVAFEVALFDSTGYFVAKGPQVNRSGFGFGFASAFSCNCAFPFRSNQFISALRITSLYPISPEIPAGSDVTELFAGRPTNNAAPGNSLYISPESLCNQTEGKIYYDSGTESFGLFLKVPVAGTRARFVIQTLLSDNTSLCDTTRLITIVQH